MTQDETRAFLLEGTRTAALATVRPDGRPHVAPVWFTLDGDDLLFNTGENTVKGANLQRDGRVALMVDDEEPPFAFVSIEGDVSLSDDLDTMRYWPPGSLPATWVRIRPKRTVSAMPSLESFSCGCVRRRSWPSRESRTSSARPHILPPSPPRRRG